MNFQWVFVQCRSAIINKSKLLQLLYCKRWQTGLLGSSNRSKECPEESWKDYLEEMAVERHRLALQEGRIRVDHLRGHSVGYCLCPYNSILPLFFFLYFYSFIVGYDGTVVILRSCKVFLNSCVSLRFT